MAIDEGAGVGEAAMRAGLHRNTARRHLERGQVPSERLEGRTYRTRPDPFAADWADLEARLAAAPGLEAKTLFEDLRARRPAAYADGHLRTLQRRVKAWRASRGPEREVFFAQEHRPGEASQTDFTYANELGITIRGEPYPHQLCHFMLPYSNWGWATPCRSESMAALFEGMQEGLWRLGGAPECSQTDNSTAATHDLRTGKRGFNAEYVRLVSHYGMRPRTTGIPDVCFETTLDGLRLQFAGGLSMDQRPVIWTTQEEAHEDAKDRLVVWRIARKIRIDRRLP